MNGLKKKKRPIYMLPTIDLFHTEGHIQTESEGLKKIFYPNGNWKKAGVGTLIGDKIDLKIKKITRNKEGHYIMIKGSTKRMI